MGITKHEAVIGVLGLSDREAIAEITALQARTGAARQLLLGPATYYNGVVSFVLLPDGAKEGSQASADVDELRKSFIAILRKHSRHWAYIVLEDEAVLPPIYRPEIIESSGDGRN